MPTRINLKDQRFGRLLVLKPIAHPTHSHWQCRCDCGTIKNIRTQLLRNGKTQSCGCLRIEHTTIASQLQVKHGHARNGSISPTWGSWRSITKRCYYPKNISYQWYGALGVTMCDRWRQSFNNFLTDMGERPKGTTIDRWPDPTGNYEPGNCRWATPAMQRANQRKT
jgi:hypothetical protein